jgi:prephenate dehydratase/prephenate dehydrogenase
MTRITATVIIAATVLLSILTPSAARPPFILPDDAPLFVQNPTRIHAKTANANEILNAPVSGPGSTVGPASSQTRQIRVCYQGEPGAYSEKSLRELLGPNVIAVARPDFESCYRAVASRECDYACLPVENSLGGSIHDNYDLQLKYDLTIVAEHECRVSHCLHALDGVKKEDIKYCMSHPQALAQCDNYLRGRGITPVPMYDTAGSAKLLKENGLGSQLGRKPERGLPDKCTPQNTAAIASELAGETYGMNCLEKACEDDDSNFTRFLLLGRTGVSQYLNKKIPAKTSIVFTLPNTPGALYKALACFSLRDIDFSKIESRPTSASLLNYLKFKNEQQFGMKTRNQADLPRFRYCFYLDFLASELDENAQNALHHLKEQAEFCRILGSYPQKSKLVGPVHDDVKEASLFKVKSREDVTMLTLPSDEGGLTLNIGIMGYGAYGQFLGRKFAETHSVRCIDLVDKVSYTRNMGIIIKTMYVYVQLIETWSIKPSLSYFSFQQQSKEAEETGAEFYPTFEMESFLKDIDVLVIAVPMIEFQSAVSSLPKDSLHNKLVVEVCPLGVNPKSILLEHLPESADIISSNPMFGPTTSSLNGQPMVYDSVRVRNERIAEAYLNVFDRARCQMVKMTAEQQDAHMADAEFVTHLAGRLLGCGKMLPPTPVSSKEYAALCDVTEMTSGDTFDLFYGMYKYNPRAKEHIAKLRENLAKVERQLAGKEAFLAAKAELQNTDRQRLIAECRQLLHEVAKRGNTGVSESEELNLPVNRPKESGEKNSKTSSKTNSKK